MDDTELNQTDAAWAEELALRILLARVRPERQAEAAERLRSLVREMEGPPRASRPPRMGGPRRGGAGARPADWPRDTRRG